MFTQQALHNWGWNKCRQLLIALKPLFVLDVLNNSMNDIWLLSMSCWMQKNLKKWVGPDPQKHIGSSPLMLPIQYIVYDGRSCCCWLHEMPFVELLNEKNRGRRVIRLIGARWSHRFDCGRRNAPVWLRNVLLDSADPRRACRVTIRYDTMRDAILACAGKPTRVGLIYRAETTTRKCKTEKLKSKNGYAQK